MPPTSEIILIIASFTTPLLAIWNGFQGLRIKELEYKYENLCASCEYSYTPKEEKIKKPMAS